MTSERFYFNKNENERIIVTEVRSDIRDTIIPWVDSTNDNVENGGFHGPGVSPCVIYKFMYSKPLFYLYTLSVFTTNSTSTNINMYTLCNTKESMITKSLFSL